MFNPSRVFGTDAVVRAMGLGVLLCLAGGFLTGCPYEADTDDWRLDACGLVSSVPACDQCMRSSCCGEALSCDQDEQCGQLTDCLSTCGYQDANCINPCERSFPAGVAPYNALMRCLGQSCNGACS